MAAVTVADIERARETIRSKVRETPYWPSLTLSEQHSVPVSLKCEHMQLTGSFKLRGATNVVANLPAAERRRGLVAASAGNHAQGIAYAAGQEGVDVTVVMPENAPLTKVTATRSYGARVILHGDSLRSARQLAEEIAEAEGRRYIPPFDDPAVVAGQGTLGLELLEQAPDMETLLIPAGGGGLLAGVATAVKAYRPEVRIIGVQSTAMDGICRSFAAGSVVECIPAQTIADGTAVAGPSELTYGAIREHVDEMVSVSEEAIARAILLLIERSRMVVEGAGALGVAALLTGAVLAAGPTVAVLSGGNIDINLLGAIVRRGLVDAGRYRHLSIRIIDRPGRLAAIAGIVAAGGGNIISVNHDREARGLDFGTALLDLVVEVNGEEHFQEITAALREAGFEGGAAAAP